MKFNKRRVAALVAELIGTFALTIGVLSINRYGIPFFTAIIAGVSLALLVAMFSYISGGHFNPAVTTGMLVARKITFIRALMYVSVQFLGATAAWKLYEYLTGRALEAANAQFDWKVFTAEAVGTLIFTAAIAAAVSRGFDTLQRTVVIGSGLFVGASIASLASSAVLNPAIALGLQSFTYEYAFGPLAGAVAGIVGYMYLFDVEAPKDKKIFGKKTK